ncbi:low specificity L-threonine aldolase [Salinifilum aidingensis]
MTSARPSPAGRHDPQRCEFASDNYSGIHPEVLEAIQRANGGHQVAYGEDVYSAHLGEVFRARFGATAEAYCVFNGTGANVVALQAMTERWQSVLCAEGAHINTDECGAPERIGGVKLLPVPTEDGKLRPEDVDRCAAGIGDAHRAQPAVVSLTQPTEGGACYSPEELRALCTRAHERGMAVHVDGARLPNAAAALGADLAALTADAGVDVVSFGGTKNGTMCGDAVVVLAPGAVRGVEYLRKSSMQLASKMRFLSVQFEALLAGDLWLRNARHANAMARRLADAVRALPGVRLVREPEVNSVFAVLPREVTERLQKRFRFYTWDERTGEVRWMTTFDTTESAVDEFAAALAEELRAHEAQ